MESTASESCAEAEIERMKALYDIHTSVNKRKTNLCDSCGGPTAPLKCQGCERRFHTLCLRNPALTVKHLPDKAWECPCCGKKHLYGMTEALEKLEEHEVIERMGLTPDWIISAAAFGVFGLAKPHVSCPKIMGLLDPCTNSKVAPNIPAEKMYDKADNGLKLSNSWAGYYVLLNPDCKFLG